MGGACVLLPGNMCAVPHAPSLLMFRQLLADEDPEVTYELAKYFTSTMVEFQTRI
jgi:hypothetical protein|tara:strand:- start:1115 stop:1279 length:165 start_codon:yes stop_codon:yes gene_type:complete